MTFLKRKPLQYGDSGKPPAQPTIGFTANDRIRHRRKRSAGFKYREADHDIDVDRFVPQSVLRAEYGMLFQHQGMLIQNIQRRYLFVAMDLPTTADLEFKAPVFPDCHDYGYLRQYQEEMAKDDDTILNDEPLHQNICIEFNDLYDSWFQTINAQKERIEKKIHTHLPSILPNKIYNTTYGYAVKTAEGKYVYSKHV